MADRPRLKAITVERDGAHLVLWPRALKKIHLDDPTGAVAALLRLLADGTHPTGALRGALAEDGFPVTDGEVTAVLEALDGLGVLEDAGGDDLLDPATRERHASNLRFYDIFARLDRPSAAVHRSLADATVLLLGAGGLGSGVLQSLVGLGVGAVTLVDHDTVETRNLARQFTYGLGAVGRPKVAAASDWVSGYSTGTVVRPVQRRVADVDTVERLGAGADLVVCAIDSPADAHLIVNEACFRLGVPLVAGGLSYSTLSYWSVDPGRTPCRQCLELHRADETGGLVEPPFIEATRVNRATGPVVQLLCGLMGLEIMRYLTGIEPPVAGAAYHVIELADGMATSRAAWDRHPKCPLCG